MHIVRRINKLAVIMKYILTILILALFYSVKAQNNATLIDTSYHNNGNIQVIFEYDSVTHNYDGKYLEYDSTGVLLIEGNYDQVDSTTCKDCYDVALINFGMKPDQVKYNKAEPGFIKVGVWKYYYPNGKIQMSGTYSKSVHAHQGYPEPTNKIDSGPYNVWIAYEDLKDGEWTYFDEKGNKIKTELFVDGSLILTIDNTANSK